MEPAKWIILFLVTVGGIGLFNLFMFFRRRDVYARRPSPSDNKTGPSPSDKYLPAWVILSMSAAVWVLASQMNTVVKDICDHVGRCQTAASAPASTVQKDSDEAKAKADAKARSDAETDADAKAKAEAEAEAEAKVAEAKAAASAVPVPPKPKSK